MKGLKLRSRLARIYCDRDDLNRFYVRGGLHKLKKSIGIENRDFKSTDFVFGTK